MEKELPKLIESRKKIRFQDCDPFNHLNNGRYVDYYINAREDQIFQNYGIDLFEIIKKEGLGWVVASNQVAYLKPVFTMETVVLQSQLFEYSDKHLRVEMKMWNEDKTVLKSFAWFTFVPFNIVKNKVTPHDERFSKLFAQVHLEIPHKNFEEREFYYRSKQRKKSK